jgi:hypothetical protein
MAATSDIFEHHNRGAKPEKGSQSKQVAQLRLVDEWLLEEFAQRLADKLTPLLTERLADGLGLTREQLREARRRGPREARATG